MFADSRLSPLPHVPARAPAMPPALRVGLIGMGTVGTGVWRVLRRNQALIAARAGRAVEIVAVATRTPARAAAAQAEAPGLRLLDDPLRLAADPGVDVLLELAGGSAARDWVLAALAQGKHVVTANKALLAEHGEQLAQAAVRHGRVLAYEAAVAGAVPVIKALREGLAGNRIDALAGVLNGTSNYILTRMQAAGLDFATALAEAQALGYAEADPSLDVDGTDAAHKLTLLAANAFGLPPALDAVHVEGLRDLQPGDMAAAAQLGYVVKLLAIARRGAQGMELRVHPALVPAQHALARLDGASNGLLVRADAAGEAFFSGAGAGGEPTASAVLADLVDLARHPGTDGRWGGPTAIPTLGLRADAPAAPPAHGPGAHAPAAAPAAGQDVQRGPGAAPTGARRRQGGAPRLGPGRSGRRVAQPAAADRARPGRPGRAGGRASAGAHGRPRAAPARGGFRRPAV